MPSFYFEQLLQTGLNGIDQQGITAAVLANRRSHSHPQSVVVSL